MADSSDLLSGFVRTGHFEQRRHLRHVPGAAIRAVLSAPFVRHRQSGGRERLSAPVLRGSRRRWLSVVLARERRLITCYWHGTGRSLQGVRA